MQKPQNSLIEKGIRKRYCLHPVDNPLRSDRPDTKKHETALAYYEEAKRYHLKQADSRFRSLKKGMMLFRMVARYNGKLLAKSKKTAVSSCRR